MPPGKIKINHINRRNPDRVERCVIVDQFPAQVGEMTSQFQRLRRRKYVARHFCRRILRERDRQRTVADHVEQDPAAKLFGSTASELPGEITASVEPINFGKVFIRFFAVKKRELNLCSQIWMLPEHPTQFQQQTCARPAIVSSDKPEAIESLRIVVGAQQKRGPAAPLCGKSCNQIHKPDFAARGVIRECLSAYLPTRQTE